MKCSPAHERLRFCWPKFGQGDVTNATHQERKMAEAFERVLLDAAYCDLTIEDEENVEEDNDEKMDVDWDVDCENIGTRSSPSNTPFIEFGGKPIPIEQVFWSNFIFGRMTNSKRAQAKPLLGGVVGLI
ncbi:hypothetical protein Y032_0069g399 [Ancylostoma ceylanicum]|uniref:Uncharacterized protein n=1 Tax=Ancylostoma ceylanicum TaxID=53326 RepID=A0A016TXK7_9BILA|nr:hypothetical protein Y032_0069g399 [Ancylostoma ceylanicum]